jgi:hypothetical protein
MMATVELLPLLVLQTDFLGGGAVSPESLAYFFLRNNYEREEAIKR